MKLIKLWEADFRRSESSGRICTGYCIPSGNGGRIRWNFQFTASLDGGTHSWSWSYRLWDFSKVPGKGYAAKGLEMLLEIARKIVPEEEIYLSVHKDNLASLNVQKKNGAYIHHENEAEYFTRIPLKR